MAGSGFQVFKRRAAGADVIDKLQSTSATQYLNGDLLSIYAAGAVKGVGTKVAADDKPTHIYEGFVPQKEVFRNPTDKSTTLCEPILGTQVAGALVELISYLTGDAVPLVNGVACNTNATASSVLCTTATTDNDYDNGTGYCPELDEQVLISDSQETGGVTTFTVTPPFSRALTVGDTFIAVPFSKGHTAVKGNATTPHRCLSTTPADKTGGHHAIVDVNLKGDGRGPYVISACPDLE